MDFSIQESAEVLLAVIVFSLLMRFIYLNFETLQNELMASIATWCQYGL